MRLTFHGAAGEVTGSCFLVDTGEIKFLVDCGMFQGGGMADARNRSLAFAPREIAFVLLTHAHIDHSGLIPRLVAQGFRGAVYATQATCDLLEVMLPDSGHLQEKESEWEGGTPLYTQREAQASLKRLLPVEYDADVQPHGPWPAGPPDHARSGAHRGGRRAAGRVHLRQPRAQEPGADHGRARLCAHRHAAQPHQAPPALQHLAPRVRPRVRRLPGGRHARPAHRRWREERAPFR